MKYHNIFPQLRSSVGVDPVPEVRDPHVNSWSLRGTADPPGHETHHGPSPRLGLTDQRRSSISSAGVLPNLSPSTDLTGVQLEPVSNSTSLIVESKLEVSVTAAAGHQRQSNLLLNELELTVHLVLAPAGHVTSDPGTVGEEEVELVVARGEAGRVDVGVVEADVSVCVEDGEIIVQTASIELRMFEDPDDGVLRVIELLGRLEATSVPLSNTDFQ